MIFLAPLVVTVVYATLLALAFLRSLHRREDTGGAKQRSLADLWRGGQRRRILALISVYLGVTLVGGIVGSLIASRGGERRFAVLAWASFFGQVGFLVAFIVVLSLIRSLVRRRQMRHP